MNTAQAQVFRKVGAICAMVGGSATLIANLFHPKDLVTYDSAAYLQTIPPIRVGPSTILFSW